jgi:putative ABC transport system permease protein
VLAEEAAHDLHLEVGDTVKVEHPTRIGTTGFDTKVTSFPVTGLHPDPIRVNAYIDLSAAPAMGLEGLTNVVQIHPRVSQEAVQRELFGSPSVASVQGVASMARAFHDLLDQFVDILRFMQLFVLALAVLIAFNAASISVDERVRENATMFAFGVRVPRVLRMGMIEGLFIGLLGTIIGIIAGMGVVRYVVQVLAEDTMHEFGLSTHLTSGTAALTICMGVAAAAIAPLFTVKKLRRMDVPAALRVIE